MGARFAGGALLPFGLHKGSGLMLMVELLAGALTGPRPEGGGTVHPKNHRRGPTTNNVLAVLFDPLALGMGADSASIDAEVAAFVEFFKASPPLAGSGPVLVPGEPERLKRRAREMAVSAGGGIAVPGRVWNQILGAAEWVGLSRAEMERIASPPR